MKHFTETPQEVLTELCKEAVTSGDDELMAHGRALLTLVMYHALKCGKGSTNAS